MVNSKFRFSGRGSGRVEIFKFALYLSSKFEAKLCSFMSVSPLPDTYLWCRMIMAVPVVASVVYGTPENMEKIVNKVSVMSISLVIMSHSADVRALCCPYSSASSSTRQRLRTMMMRSPCLSRKGHRSACSRL